MNLLRGAAALLLLLGAGACRAEVAVVDDLGHTLRLPTQAHRVVALSPQLAELSLAAGASAALVATVRGEFVEPALHALPSIGDAFAINLEALAALHPDLILAWNSGTPPRQRAALQRLGIPVYWSETSTLEQVSSTVRRIGTLTGTAHAATVWADAFDARLRRLRAAHAGLAALPVFVQLWPQPLISAGAPQLFSQALRVCGARNVFDDLPQPSATVAREAVLARHPALVVAADADPAALDTWRGLPLARARLDPDRMPRMGLRLLDGVEQLCTAVDAARAARTQRATQ